MKNLYKLTAILSLIALVVSGISIATLSCKKGPETYKIGAILPLTGPLGFIGETQRYALNMAEEKVNAEGGIKGRKLEIIIEDSKNAPKDGITIANKFIIVNKIKAIITFGTAVSLAIQPIAEKEKVIQMVLSIKPDITDFGKYTFRVFYTVQQATKLYLKYLEHVKAPRIALLYQNGEAWIKQVEYLLPEIEKLGTPIAAKETFEQGTQDFRPQVLKIQQAKPDLLIILGYGSHFPAIFKSVGEAKLLGKLKILGGLDFLEIPKDAPTKLFEGVVFAAPALSTGAHSKKSLEFIDTYEKKYGKRPDHQAGYIYDMVMLLAEAIKARGYDVEAIRNYLLQIKEFEGVSGRIDVLPNRDTRSALVLATYKDGKVLPFNF
jgi:branched-chain amino acid transport system substrate-binding protein